MKKNNFLFPAALAALILSDPALAAAGTQSLNNTLQTILIVTGAIIWAGYRMLYTHANIQTVGGPFLGACLIAAAPWLAELLVG